MNFLSIWKQVFVFFIIFSCTIPKNVEQEIRYYEDGNVLSIRSLRDGKLNGRLIHFYQSGDTMEIQTWKKGVLDGTVIKYFPTGGVKYKAKFVDDHVVGKAVTFKSEMEIALVQNYNSNGVLTHEYMYEDGRIINDFTFFYLDPRNDTLYQDRDNLFDFGILNLEDSMSAGIDFGTIHKGHDFIELVDTLDIIESKDETKYINIVPTNSGVYNLSGLWYTKDTKNRKGEKRDTISIITYYEFHKTFIVK